MQTAAPGLIRAPLEAGGVGLFDTPLQRGAEVADVIGALRLGVVRHRFRRHEVSQPDRLLGQAEFARAPVDEALEDIGRFRTACATIGVDRDRVRIDASHPRMQRVDLVGPVRHRDAQPRHELSVLREIGAQVRDDVDPERQKTALGVERHLGGGHVVAPLRVADKMFGPVGLPPNRLAKPARGFENQGIFPIEKDSRAEAAADVVGQDPQVCRRDLQHLCKNVAKRVHALAAEMQRQSAACGVERPHRSTRLHVVRDDARIDDLYLHRMRGLREDLVGFRLVADMRVEGDVARGAGKDLNRARPKRCARIGDRGKRLPVDRERLCAVPGGEG